MDKKKTRKILLRLTSMRTYKNKIMKKIKKKVTGGCMVNYYDIVPKEEKIKKFYFEVNFKYVVFF